MEKTGERYCSKVVTGSRIGAHEVQHLILGAMSAFSLLN